MDFKNFKTMLLIAHTYKVISYVSLIMGVILATFTTYLYISSFLFVLFIVLNVFQKLQLRKFFTSLKKFCKENKLPLLNILNTSFRYDTFGKQLGTLRKAPNNDEFLVRLEKIVKG